MPWISFKQNAYSVKHNSNIYTVVKLHSVIYWKIVKEFNTLKMAGKCAQIVYMC